MENLRTAAYTQIIAKKRMPIMLRVLEIWMIHEVLQLQQFFFWRSFIEYMIYL